MTLGLESRRVKINQSIQGARAFHEHNDRPANGQTFTHIASFRKLTPFRSQRIRLLAQPLHDARVSDAPVVASPCMKRNGALVALSFSAPKSYGFKSIATTRLTKFGNSLGVGPSFLYSVLRTFDRRVTSSLRFIG
jgi:hypothetical protein